MIGLHFAADSMNLYIGSTFSGELRIFISTRDVSAVQGHPRSLILAPIESMYATSY